MLVLNAGSRLFSVQHVHHTQMIWRTFSYVLLEISFSKIYDFAKLLPKYATFNGDTLHRRVTVEAVPEWLEDETEMVPVVEMTKQTQAVELIFMVGIVQTLQKLQFLQTRLVPDNLYNFFNTVYSACKSKNRWQSFHPESQSVDLHVGRNICSKLSIHTFFSKINTTDW